MHSTTRDICLPDVFMTDIRVINPDHIPPVHIHTPGEQEIER